MRSPMKRGFTLIELLVVIAIIAILASILFPVFAKAREKARQATCTSQVRQIATAIQMYVQDNGSQYPGVDGGSTWAAKINQYLGNSDQMFHCPSDTESGPTGVSYAYAGLLVRSSGLGVKEAAVYSPSEVGALCDATPAGDANRLIGGGALAAEETNGAKPKARHSNGIVTGYCDGHAKYYQGSFDEKDMASDATRAFYMVASLGLIDNPTGMQCTYTAPAGWSGTGIANIGGEYAVAPFLNAAAAVYANGSYTRGFLGQGMTTGRNTANYAWGYGSITPGGLNTTSAIAYDAICVIVAKGSKIPTLPTMSKKTYIVSTAYMATCLSKGYIKDSIQVYKMADYTGTTQYVKKVLRFTNPVDSNNYVAFGLDSIQVENDAQMVEKVANDPYAIGYCSSAYADPDRVVVLGVDVDRNGSYSTGDWVWPSASDKFRWVMPATVTESSWGWKRSLDVTATAVGTGGAYIQRLVQGTEAGGFMDKMQLGPYFKVGYWAGKWY